MAQPLGLDIENKVRQQANVQKVKFKKVRIENPQMPSQDMPKMLLTLSNYEQKMQSYRQLLNEQIQFNIKDLYMKICNNNAQVTAYHLHLFINEHQDELVDLTLIESMIKTYNHCTSMNLSFIQFAIIFLSRENKLLAKLTIERNSLGEMPAYLLGYAKKILQLETQLHRQLLQFRKINSIAAEKWIKQNTVIDQSTGSQIFDEQVLIKMCQQLEIDPNIVIRYLKVSQKEPIKIEKMLSVFTLKNCQKLSQFLKKSQKGLRPQLFQQNTDPFIRPEFHDCLQRPKLLQNFSHRQIKSIQKHLSRLNSNQKCQLPKKIDNYRQHIQKQLIAACESINSIIRLEQQIQAQRVQLCLCTDFYPILFFDSFNKDKHMLLIPSSMQSYLEKLGVRIELNGLYAVFKRYSGRVDGKLSFNQFCLIFDVCSPEYYQIQKNRLVKNLQDVELQTIRNFLKLIKKLVKNELKIQRIKARLQQSVDLRQIFNILDEDEDGYISMTDLKVVWKKYLLMDLKDNQLLLFWHRMKLNKSTSTMIKYEKFISELTPKSATVQKLKQKSMNNVKKQTTRK